MSFTCRKLSTTDDRYYTCRHNSGVTIFVYEKPDAVSTSAVFGTSYGSFDESFVTHDGKRVDVPAGIAHFLEHKMFEKESGDVTELFAQTGAESNAYTSYDKTFYLFSCTDHAEKNLEILLDFVTHPYFTAESAQKEQGIIAQEIMMYNDSPDWRVFKNVLCALYSRHPIRLSVAGTVESIAQINDKLLYECYNAFYTPDNMVLSVAGNITKEKVLEIADKYLHKGNPAPEHLLPDEPADITQSYIEESGDVSQPLFCMGFKEDSAPVSDAEVVISSVILEILAGRPSTLYNQLLINGLINKSFDHDFMYFNGANLFVFSGESSDPEAVKDAIINEIAALKLRGITEEELHWAKRSLYGHEVSGFDNMDAVANALAASWVSGEDIMEQIEILASLTVESVNAYLPKILSPDRIAFSVIKPKIGGDQNDA